MAFHQVFREQEIPDSWQNCDQQNPNRRFALVEETLHQHERALEIAGRERVSQFKNDAGAREWHQLAHLLDADTALGATMQIDLLQLVLDLTRIATGQQNEKIERVVIELKF